MRHLFIIFALILLLGIANGSDLDQSTEDLPVHKTRIEIINDLPFGFDLTVHCKAKDDDIPIQVLRPQQRFEFTVIKNVWITTQYFCSFKWEEGFHYYDIYIQKRDGGLCPDECVWNIKADGPCRFNPDNGNYDLCDKWNPPDPSLS